MSSRILITNTALGALTMGAFAAASFESQVGDLREMAIAGAQIDWDGLSSQDGQVAAWASMTGNRFSLVKGSTLTLDTTTGSYVWNFGVTGWRYIKFIYTHNSVSSGTITIWAAGKKNG